MGQSMDALFDIVTDTDTYMRIRARARYNSTGAVDDSVNDFTATGDMPGNVTNVDKDISIPYGGGSQILHDVSLTVDKTYGATQRIDFAASISGINYWGSGKVIDSWFYTVPARAYTAPSAPGTPSV